MESPHKDGKPDDEDYTPLKSSQEKLKRKEGIKGECEFEIQNINYLKKKSNLIEDGNPPRCRLQTRTDDLDQSEPYRKMTFGERHRHKPHKTILLVGETGTGETSLIDVMINYMLGVQREDKVWFEITDDQSDRTQAHSQTSSITVYEFYLQESPIHLTIIDTPGYGDTRGIEKDKEIAESLLSLSKSAEGIHEIDTVCLVNKATQNRLSDRQQYIFDAVQSLFEREDKKQKKIQEQSLDRSFSGMEQFFKYLNTIKPKSLQMTLDVLKNRKQLEANISNLQSRVQMMELKQNELKQTQEAVEKNKKDVEENKNFQYEVDVVYKEQVDVDPAVASVATCCTVCEENCHYPGCWWVSDLSWCEVMKNDHCTVCTNKCHYSKHVREAKIYVSNTKKEKRTYEDLKKKYDGKIRDGESLVKKLEEELQGLEKEKEKLLKSAFHCVENLQMIALKSDSLFILQHIDFLIEKLMEINESEKAETLENIKKRAGGGKLKAIGYLTRFKKKIKSSLSYSNRADTLKTGS
ncbi:uncharacterized protein LOC132123885 [Carassius carassius]|uniref:uncharacterized protein LOC132123885 n=1 Tax=Carassius carassius TaxID=217509 RepID=UPI002868481F|nr:uncharacterized protein LOC132123885 [Carassius carassius]